MEFNIALNTIVYLMVFIFPGILFRKFLFIREYSKEFDKGNLFERFIWILFTSITMLALVSMLFYILINVFHYKLLSYISYTTIRDTFIELSANQLPDPKKEGVDIKKIYFDFALLMFTVYFFSIIFGTVAYFITKSKFIKGTGLLKYLNYYEDIVKGSNEIRPDDTLTYGYTIADVLVDTGDGSKLYSGRVKNYYLASDSNRFQTIVLCEVLRYKKVDTETITVEIPGHNFLIEKDRILNINFTYVYESKSTNISFKRQNAFINFISVAAFFLVVSLLFIGDVNIYFSTVLRKAVFVMFALSTISLLNEYLKVILSRQWSRLKRNDTFNIIFSLLPFLWIFNVTTWYYALTAQIITLLIGGIFLKSDKNSKNTEDISKLDIN